MIRTRALIALCMLAGLAGGAHAAQADPPSFDSLDKDRDGKVSLNEAAEHDALFVAFKSLDADKDGALTRAEFAAFRRDKPAA
jgi:hypothetical protein